MPERIKPGHPEQNGRHERMHRTLKQEVMNPPAATPQAQQEECHSFLSVYNTVRPHEALGQIPPASLYLLSPRPYPQQLGDVQYPPLTEVRRVRSNGQIKWRGELVFVSEALVGELVGITEDKDAWLVSFGPIPLGLLYPHRSSLSPFPQPTPPIPIGEVLPMCLVNLSPMSLVAQLQEGAKPPLMTPAPFLDRFTYA